MARSARRTTGVSTFVFVTIQTIGAAAFVQTPNTPQQQASAQQPAPQQTSPTTPASKPAAPDPKAPAKAPATPVAPEGIRPPVDYVIGPEDVLAVVFWREEKMSGEVVVRPDGMVSLPLINDIQAAGLTVDQFRARVSKAAERYITEPAVAVLVRGINSRKVFVTGQVNKPGPFPMNDSLTVLQMLALAGGLTEFAKSKDILIMRTEGSQTKSYRFNYKDVTKGKNLQQNILLKPGDTIVVP
jgi:polysaccharide export outer membrane protein